MVNQKSNGMHLTKTEADTTNSEKSLLIHI